MKTSLLSLVDRFTQKLGPLSSTIDAVVGHIVPQKTASACAGQWCDFWCSSDACGTGQHAYYKRYAQNGGGCFNGIYTCYEFISCC
jgi:hypothetical protein